IGSDNTGGNVAYSATFNSEEDIYYLRVSPSGGGNLSLLSAQYVQRALPIDLPLTGPSGVECRSGGRQGSFTVDFTFNNNLTAVGSGATSWGSVVSTTIDSSDHHRFIVNLGGATCNEQDVTITLTNVTDD